jgi:hypothetical protein
MPTRTTRTLIYAIANNFDMTARETAFTAANAGD